ncbi:MAG: hypothetical protein COV91_01485 [Candidatus Taylorbacteria bacterium CG11_big_fil_rev_8_21_14_0_20_46_11]|uniref:Uncharacterized protein n=1 Tax=Candidatus Taylorbacteria bacterium CG11_big_fil_rev_8_21_14_0_20_46_11 TaxID=1975025 RepID=A0A2H0KE98_9BACT|nr:MAG: hypothetical protein COV91_01485 [Candidatus Taylorbacteria bacterium CG11_big_fil_rev_8_21_14_0_20_46_11]
MWSRLPIYAKVVVGGKFSYIQNAVGWGWGSCPSASLRTSGSSYNQGGLFRVYRQGGYIGYNLFTMVLKVKTTYPPAKELAEIRRRDITCVYCSKRFDRTREQDRDTVEHLNHRQDWDSVGSYMREGKPVSEIVAICCMECNRNRGAKPLLEWFGSKYCVERTRPINYQTVAQVVRNYINKYEKE